MSEDAHSPPAGPESPAPRIHWAQELLLLASVCLILAGLDQWSKGWAVDRLGPLHRDYAGRLRPPPDKEPVEVIDGALRFSITGNEGAIWGLGRDLSNTYKRPFFISLSVLAMGFILLLLRGSMPEQRLRRLGLACVLSGAVGNLIDRVRSDYVVDFIDWYWGYNWPTFNVADVAITVGVILVVIDLYWHPDPVDETKEKEAETANADTGGETAEQASDPPPEPEVEDSPGDKSDGASAPSDDDLEPVRP